MAADSTRSSLELLYNVSRELASALELRKVLQTVLSLSLANVGGERGSLVVLDEQGQPLDAAIVYRDRIQTHTIQQLRETVDRGLAGWVVRNGKPALVPDTSKDERWLRRADDSAEHSGPKSAICVPLHARERLVGVLTVVHPKPGTFNQEHLALIQAIADQAGVAVLNARLYEQSQRQARVMTALAQNAVALNASLRLDEVLQRILEQTAQALRVEVVALALVDKARDELVYRAASGEGGTELLGLRIPLGKGVAGRVARSGRGLVAFQPADDEVVKIEGLAVRALACAPVHARGNLIGVLEAINPLAGSFDPDALLVLTGIGSLAGTAIQNAQLYEQLEATHRRYRELFDDSIDPILITDWSGRILEANRRAVLLFGKESAALRSLTIQMLHNADMEKLGSGFLRLKTGETITYESSVQAAEGRAIPVEVYVRMVNFEDAQNLQWILRDISERKDLDNLREDLLAMIYHDLRSPLANVVSSLDVLTTLVPQEENPAIQSVLNIAIRSTDRIQRLISSLLDIRRLEAGQPIAGTEEVQPDALVREAVETVRPLADSKQQQIEVSRAEMLANLWVDSDMIRRVLINLLENAVKFTPSNGRVVVGVRPDGPYARFWVQDTGPGIPADQRERIFDKFTRLQVENAPKGMGLGLAFCRLAVEAHGGKIWVESPQEGGSRFVFTLPSGKRP